MNEYDFYDYEKGEKFNNERHEKYLDLAMRRYKSKEKGNDEAAKKALKAMLKHQKEDQKYKEMAEKAGYCWH